MTGRSKGCIDWMRLMFLSLQEGLMRRTVQQEICRAVIGLMMLFASTHAFGSVSLLVEEPFGRFGAFNPTGHAAIYLDHVCADTPTRLRMCRAGEMGVVVSRYHRVGGYDWVAVPLIPYLYAVEDLSDVPETATPALEAQLRDAYRREHLMELAPDAADGKTPRGEWIQLVGSSYDRKIYGFELPTTTEQDERLVAKLNDSRNRAHFNLFFNNCADFSRGVLRTLYPGSIPRNALADFWLTTPKHLAKSMTKFGQRDETVDLKVFQIPQVPGTIERSRKINGIAESLVRSKKYMVPLLFVSPTTAGSLLAAYVGTGRFRMPKSPPVMEALQPVDALGISLTADAIALPIAASPVPGTVCSAPLQREAVTETLLSGGGGQ